jgi:hypothetical protein
MGKLLLADRVGGALRWERRVRDCLERDQLFVAGRRVARLAACGLSRVGGSDEQHPALSLPHWAAPVPDAVAEAPP